LERGFVSLGSSLLYLQQKLNVSANNISNLGTYGFKKDTVIGQSFNGILSDEMSKNISPAEVRLNSGENMFKPGVYIMSTVTDFKQGILEETGKYNDLALHGEGFLVFEGQNGPVYGRGDSLSVDEQGFLAVTGKGRITGRNGFIQVGKSEYVIDRSGNVAVNGRLVERINVINFADPKSLTKTGNGTFIHTAGDENIILNPDVLFVQGSLEASNSDLSEETVTLSDVLRKYEAVQRAFQMADQIYGLAVNDLGKV